MSMLEETGRSDHEARRWRPGDLVRIVDADSARARHSPALAGQWGVVVEHESDFSVWIDRAGYSLPLWAPGGASVFASSLVPWKREPADETALRDNLLAVLKDLAFNRIDDIVRDEDGGLAISSVSIPNGYLLRGATIHANKVLAAELAPYLDVDRLKESAGRLLDENGFPRSRTLPGGGNNFRVSYCRDGQVAVQDLGTGTVHGFIGEAAEKIVEARLAEVGWNTDGRFPALLRSMLPFPRTLRRDPISGLVVLEMSANHLEVRRPGEDAVTFRDEHAGSLARACRRVGDLSSWIEERLASSPAETHPTPGL